MSIPALRKINSVFSGRAMSGSGASGGVLTAFFLLGAFVGSLVGVYSGGGDLSFSASSGSTGGAWLFFLLLLIFSTSYLGLVFIPVLMAFRGYIFSCSLAVLWFSLGSGGLLLSLLGSALPLCFLLPCYVLIGDRCMRLSHRLASCVFGRAACAADKFPLRYFAVMIFMAILDGLYCTYLLPGLSSALI